MQLRYGLISVDEHVQEHPRVWTDRLSKKWGDRVPHVERQPGGSERWAMDGRPMSLDGVASAAALMADRTVEPQRWDEVPAAAFDPTARLQAMDADGVDAAALYPTVAGVAGETFARLSDPDLELDCVRAYNDFLVEEWASASDRFIPQCIVPLLGIDRAVGEIERAVGRGHRGVLLPSVPSELRDAPHINDSYWDPIWATCQELGVPLCFHAGASERIQLLPHDSYSPILAEALRAMTRPVSSVFVLVNFLMSRILVRYPSLKVVFAESGIAWAAYVFEYADHQFEKDRLFDEGYDLKPSEMFHRQCYLTAWYEAASVQTRRFVGVENILWATHFPLATSTWPSTGAAIARWAPGVPEEERRQMLWANAARLYKLDVAAVGPGESRTAAALA